MSTIFHNIDYKLSKVFEFDDKLNLETSLNI